MLMMMTMMMMKTTLMKTLAMKCQRWHRSGVSTMMRRLKASLRGDQVSMPCRTGEVDEDCISFRVDGAC